MLDVIRKRRSIRAFLKKDVEDKKLNEVLKAAMFAPTSWGTRAWEFVVVKDPVTKKKLSEATAHSRFVKDAPVVVVICYNIKAGRRFCEDSSIAAEHIHLEAINQGLASCFVQVAQAGEPQGSAEPFVIGLLRIPDHLRVQCMMPLGYAKRELKEHNDREFDTRKVHNERF
ncbi:MAG TPA: NAD(P)H nitroreductase [Nitrospiraceae bacterium]|nr:MAG: hypothetical protein A2054_09660 [Deltaproteobacteria bacterium GWA2_55_10]HCZ11031.1 NAD(P)H nitroreductase [Nitrospiraceae bacterium]